MAAPLGAASCSWACRASGWRVLVGGREAHHGPLVHRLGHGVRQQPGRRHAIHDGAVRNGIDFMGAARQAEADPVASEADGRCR